MVLLAFVAERLLKGHTRGARGRDRHLAAATGFAELVAEHHGDSDPFSICRPVYSPRARRRRTIDQRWNKFGVTGVDAIDVVGTSFLDGRASEAGEQIAALDRLVPEMSLSRRARAGAQASAPLPTEVSKRRAQKLECRSEGAELSARPARGGGPVSVPIHIPKLGVSMTEGTLVEWLVADGDQVSVGQPLYVIETDKVENEVEANAEGIIRISGEAGETYPVGESIGQIET